MIVIAVGWVRLKLDTPHSESTFIPPEYTSAHHRTKGKSETMISEKSFKYPLFDFDFDIQWPKGVSLYGRDKIGLTIKGTRTKISPYINKINTGKNDREDSTYKDHSSLIKKKKEKQRRKSTPNPASNLLFNPEMIPSINQNRRKKRITTREHKETN